MRRPELLAPGGSFLAAYHAVEAGADGIYLGLKEFSARSAAANFTLEQLRRIRGLAAERGRRLYVAINTVIRDVEIPRVAESLAWLAALGVDGVIVQDLGVAAMARQLFPSLALHASTQMAVHNAAGVRLLADLGFRRVILSRELTLAELSSLRRSCPAIELEVFVHGALCYSFSGACLASWALTGRSGNRGDCAQICRSVFTGAGAGTLFSARDLFLAAEAAELAGIGIDAFKIEGRMKSPEYAAAAVRLYRAVLDAGPAGVEERRLAALERDVELAFSRERTPGFLRSPSGTHLVDTRFAGHRGARLGIVTEVRRGAAMRLALEGDLAVRDGVGYFVPEAREPVAFAVRSIRADGRAARFARAGQVVEVPIPAEAAGLPRVGTEVRHLSSRFKDLPSPKEGSFPPLRIPVDLQVTIDAARPGTAVLSIVAAGVVAARVQEEVTLDEAHNPKPFAVILASVLGESGDSLFRAGGIALANRTSLAEERIFVPPSALKRLKNLLFRQLDAAFAAWVAAKGEEAGRGPRCEGATAAEGAGGRPTAGTPPDRPVAGATAAPAVPPRRAISPRGREPIPFAWLSGDGLIDAATLARVDATSYLPLPTLMPDAEPWIAAIDRLAADHPAETFAVGLNNVSHLAIASSLAGRGNLRFYGDVHLYVANRWTVAWLAARVPRLAFLYRWIEEPQPSLPASLPVPVASMGAGFRPPLFMSRGCFARHVLNSGTCFEGCTKDVRRTLAQGGNRFEVVVKDCVTYLFRDVTRG